MKLEIEQKLLQDTLNYLQTKPFKEVNALICELVQCKPPEKELKKKKE